MVALEDGEDQARDDPAPRPEIVWPGKAEALGRPSDPAAGLALRERIGGTASLRPQPSEAGEASGNVSAASPGNLLIHGDNHDVLAALASNSFRQEIEAAGGIRLIYLDPPFATGGSFGMEVPVGAAIAGQVKMVRVPAYRDTWDGGLTGYLSMLAPRLKLLHNLLADDGSLYFHCDYRAAAHARLLLDEIFSPDRLLNEIVWSYGLGNAGSRRTFGRKHDTILLYTKTDRYRFNEQRGEITPAMAAKYRHTRPDGTRFMRSYGKEYDLRGGKPLGSVWEIPAVAATSRERVGYPTQKPEALLERIIAASSDPGDLVLDPFCGAGTTLAVASRLGRRWIGCDASRLAIWTARKRLSPTGTPFDVMASTSVESATTGGPALAYTLRPAVAAERDGTDLRLRLVTIEVTGQPPRHVRQRSHLAIEDGQLVRHVYRGGVHVKRELLTGEWSDWLDGWAVSLKGRPGDVFFPSWETMRTARQRSLPLVSDPLPDAGVRSGVIAVRVTDIFGQSWDCTAAIP